MSSSEFIKLDIGGTIFKTSQSTLIKYDSMFRGMLESGIPLKTDSSGCVFIDRDPTHFRYILNFMRDGTVNIPQNRDTIEEILKEAEFYSIQELVDFCKIAAENSSSEPPKYYHIDKEGEEFDILMKASKKAVLKIDYPKPYDEDGPLPKSLIVEFMDKHKDNMEFAFERAKDWNCSYWPIIDKPKVWPGFAMRSRERLPNYTPESILALEPVEFHKLRAKEFFERLDKWLCKKMGNQ